MDQDQLPDTTTIHLTKSQKNRREIQKKNPYFPAQEKIESEKLKHQLHTTTENSALLYHKIKSEKNKKTKKFWLNPVQYLKLVIDTNDHEMEFLYQLW